MLILVYLFSPRFLSICSRDAPIKVRFHGFDIGHIAREVDVYIEKKVFGVGREHGFSAMDILLFRGLIRHVMPVDEGDDDVSLPINLYLIACFGYVWVQFSQLYVTFAAETRSLGWYFHGV
jgi:hypothetical protein